MKIPPQPFAVSEFSDAPHRSSTRRGAYLFIAD
jgi:hypothetical protein